jgi:hypothetical protein
VTRSVAIFLAWGIVGFIESFAMLYGFVLAPLFVGLGWLAYRYLPQISGSRMPEALGLLGGFGAFWLFLASAIDGDASAAALIGFLALGTSVAGYLALGRSRCRRGLATG